MRKSKTPSRRQNVKINLDNKTKPNIHERLQSMSPSNKHRKQGKSLSRTISKTSKANDDKHQQKQMYLKKNNEVKSNTKDNNRDYKTSIRQK